MEAYKKMYEMGEELMQMATDGGYSPDEDMEEEGVDDELAPTGGEYDDSTDSMSMMSKKKDKMSIAQSLMGKM